MPEQAQPKRPLVSVILPVRNGGTYLADAVDSILGQTFGDLELLLIDDGSTDDALARLSRADPRLSIRPAEGQGIIDALNTGLRHARGTFVARMDADDISLPHRLQAQYDHLQRHPDLDLVGGLVELIGEGAPGAGSLRYQSWLNSLRDPAAISRERFVESPLPHPTWFARRRRLEQLGGYADHGWPEDYDLLLRAAAAGMRLGKPDSVVLQWREHPARLTRTDARYALARFTAAKAHYLADRVVDGRPVVIWGAGPTGRRFADALEATNVPVAAFLEVHPRRIGGLKRGRPVVHFEEVQRYPGALILVAVGVPQARPQVREFLQSQGLAEEDDFLFVA